MRLKALEIQGFKSFADKTRLEFVGGVTAVVGPNGSGKSNIADAVRWVLGEQSTKTLRGAKMEDVIFGGTQTRGPVGYAHVQLTIDNSDKTLPDMDDEITVSRRLYRSGESEYRIGPNMVRLKDIHELFMDTGLGRDGYSIIGQGKIAEIVSAKSGARRDIFEEAAGISKFRYRKAEAEHRLGQAQENLLRLRDILSELEDRVEPLRVQSEKAKSFLTLAEEKRGLEISLWMLSLDNLKEQLSAQENKVYIAKNDYAHLERESDELETQLGAIFADIQHTGSQVESVRAFIRQLEEKSANSGSEVAVLENDIRHNELSIERLTRELDSAGLGTDELSAQLSAKTAEHEESVRAIASMQSRLDAGEERLAEQKEQLARADEALRQFGVRRESVENAISQIKLEQAASASLMMESISRLEALRQNSHVHDSTVSELEANIIECRQRIIEQEEHISSLGNTQKGYSLKREGRAKKKDELDAKAASLLDEAAQKRNRAKLLEDLESNMEGFAGSVKYILAQRSKGAISGISGAVSSLISTRDEYTTAIETSLGAAMQNIVVDDENTAKRAIRMLQDARAGRATFLPVSSISGHELDYRLFEKYDGFIGVASSLVEADRRFSGIIAQLLGRTLIVDNLDCGARMANDNGYKYRVVTLDGQVVNAGGSFTGGSTVKSVGVLGRRHEIEKLDAEARELETRSEALSGDRKALAQELSAIDASLSGTVGELQSASEEKLKLGFALEGLEKSLTQAKDNRELAAKELKSLTKRLEQIEQGETSSTALMSELSAQLDGLAAQISSAAARRETLALGNEAAAAAISEQRMAHLSAAKDIDLLAAESERIRLQIESAGTRVEQLETERMALKSQNEEIAQKIERLHVEKTAIISDIEERNKAVASLMEKRTVLEAETTSLRAKEREISGRREDVSRELARLEERRHAVQAEYDGIIAKLWDEYELTRSAAATLVVELPDKHKSERLLSELRGKIKALGTVNLEAIEEYAQVSERYNFLSAQVNDVENAKEQLLKMIFDLTAEMRELFADNFKKIASNFSRIFVQLFGGGRAELSLTDESDVLESGVEIYVQPPGKVIKSLSLLSGGEQAFVAIAIYFAILKVKPAPFCLIDEIEAALDDVNVVKFASYLRQMCDKTQFISITHRRGTMEEADVLYGVTMQDEGVSKLLELKVNEVEEKLGIK